MNRSVLRLSIIKLKKQRWFINGVHCYHILLSKIMPVIIKDEKAVEKYYRKLSCGKKLDLNNTVTFSQKQQWYKLNSRDPLMAVCADKHEVRQYIINCGYSGILNQQYGVYDTVDEIPIDVLPRRFVLKASHASGWNLIVKDKLAVNWKQEKRTMKLWLKQDNYWCGREWVYKNLKKRIVAEKYLEDRSGGLLDYKFYCFDGKPQFLQVEVGRGTKEQTRNFYNMNWELMPFGKELEYNPNLYVEKPVCFKQMIDITSNLSKPFSYVRVDLYEVEGAVIFGELTFFPAGGAPDFIPSEYDSVVGNMWDISGISFEQ